MPISAPGPCLPERSTDVKTLRIALFSLWALSVLAVQAQDPGLEKIGKVRTELIYATNGDITALGAGAKELEDKAEVARLKKAKKIGKFEKFVKLGSVEQPVLKGYKSWAAPIKNSEAILLTFQPQAKVVADRKLRLDIEYWQKKKMAWRWDRVFEVGKKIYLMGPKWREGNLIITVELVSLKDK